MTTTSTESFRKLRLAFLILPLVAAVTGIAQQPQLSLVDIVAALRSKKATAAEKNQILAEGVKLRGVTFALNQDLEKELRGAGADDRLIASIREKSPAAKPEPTPQPKPDPTPAPAATPKPPDAMFYQNRANASFVMGDLDAAIKDYGKAIELNPDEATAFFSRGMAYFNKKNFNPAIADFGRVIELDPNESMAFYNRGNALENIGEFEKALNDFNKAVELDAENEPAKAALQRLEAKIPKPVQPTAAKSAATQIKPQPAEDRPKVVVPSVPYNAGSLRDHSLKLAVPQYPAMEKQNRVEGVVTVQVTIDEEGKVVSAKAMNGPKGLRAASEDAAKRSKFKPVVVDGKPVKANGTVVYNFKLS
jgi:TonB family protein